MSTTFYTESRGTVDRCVGPSALSSGVGYRPLGARVAQDIIPVAISCKVRTLNARSVLVSPPPGLSHFGATVNPRLAPRAINDHPFGVRPMCVVRTATSVTDLACVLHTTILATGFAGVSNFGATLPFLRNFGYRAFTAVFFSPSSSSCRRVALCACGVGSFPPRQSTWSGGAVLHLDQRRWCLAAPARCRGVSS